MVENRKVNVFNGSFFHKLVKKMSSVIHSTPRNCFCQWISALALDLTAIISSRKRYLASCQIKHIKQRCNTINCMMSVQHNFVEVHLIEARVVVGREMNTHLVHTDKTCRFCTSYLYVAVYFSSTHRTIKIWRRICEIIQTTQCLNFWSIPE